MGLKAYFCLPSTCYPFPAISGRVGLCATIKFGYRRYSPELLAGSEKGIVNNKQPHQAAPRRGPVQPP